MMRFELEITTGQGDTFRRSLNQISFAEKGSEMNVPSIPFAGFVGENPTTSEVVESARKIIGNSLRFEDSLSDVVAEKIEVIAIEEHRFSV